MAQVKVPELAESVTEGTIAEWLINEGDSIDKGQPIAEIETDKINVEINSDYSGTVESLMKQPGDTIQVGEVIASIIESDHKPDENSKASSTTTNNNSSSEQESNKKDKGSSNEPIASPAARKKAREMGIDLKSVKTRDPLGRIRAEDVEEASNQNNREEKKDGNESSKTAKSEINLSEKRTERIKMSRRRQTIASRLLEAQQSSAMLTTFNEIDMSAVMELRKKRKEQFAEKHNIKLGFMSFFTKAVVGALKQFPYLNAEIQENEIVLKKFYDIGIAVAAKEGLVVPVVRNADQKTFAEIERDIADLAEKANTNKLSIDNLQGGSFSITNGGIFGSLFSTPILNTPQVGILGMHTIQKRPVVINDKTEEVAVRPMMYVALSYDHRIVDGSEAVQFLASIKEMIEDPESLLLEG